MTLKVSSYGSSGGLRYKIAYEDACAEGAEIDALGSAGTIRSVVIWNKHSGTVYFKLKTTSGAWVSGTTDPDYQWRMPATTTNRFDFPDGIPFSQLTFWCNASSASSATDGPGGVVDVTFVCS
jgi:hypothetical protein